MKNRISVLRNNKHMSQTELSKEIHVAPSTIGMWETGKRAIKDKDLSMLSDYFGVSTDYILGKKESTNKNETNDLDDLSNIMMFEGRPIPEEDRETVKAVLRSLRQRREEMDRKKNDK